MRLRFTPRASRQVEAISVYLGERSPAAARRIGLRIREAARFLTRFPHIGHKGVLGGTYELVIPDQRGQIHLAGRGVLGGTYELVIPDIPYILVYRLERPELNALSILGVYHTAQLRPGQAPPATED
ncbi:MAG: type II toxin-antitoxin system RelE/ParE family toxin [Rhizobiales bacterium]|nr:type II toxin-antitoxin system RelE/ParE family toxin [Hyphomicrobiales bacterium]